MYTTKRLTFFYAVTPVHLGSGQALGVIDNPIQRERHTEHPSFAGSGIKGALRHAAGGCAEDEGLIPRIFGPDRNAAEHAGAISFADAQLVAFPVRSLKGVFVYATSPLALQRMARLAAIAGVEMPAVAIGEPAEDEAVVLNTKLTPEGRNRRLVLESYAFAPREDDSGTFKAVAAWLAEHALLDGPAHSFFRGKLKQDLVLLSDTQFTYFACHATSVEPHVRINDETGTAEDGGLFFTENLPPESILVSLAMASEERIKKGSDRENVMSAEDIMGQVIRWFGDRTVQIGGDASTGRGQVLVRFVGGDA